MTTVTQFRLGLSNDVMLPEDGTVLIYAHSIVNFNLISGYLGEVAGRAFGYGEAVSADKMSRQLADLHSVTVAVMDGQIVGYQSQKQFAFDGGVGLYNSRTVLPEFQSRQVGRKLMLATLEQSNCVVIAGRTQNPAAVLSCQRALELFGKPFAMYPFYADGSGELPQSILAGLIAYLQMDGKVDRATYVQKDAYHGKRLGDYVVKAEHPVAGRIDKFMYEAGLDRDRGDAIFHFAVIQR